MMMDRMRPNSRMKRRKLWESTLDSQRLIVRKIWQCLSSLQVPKEVCLQVMEKEDVTSTFRIQLCQFKNPIMKWLKLDMVDLDKSTSSKEINKPSWLQRNVSSVIRLFRQQRI
jgi:hypothetical protein